jgi:hypothetical protein
MIVTMTTSTLYDLMDKSAELSSSVIIIDHYDLTGILLKVTSKKKIS